ncbi:transcriptional repressor LexA [Arenicella sp. 4NH20-0111]|uniref:transcriptional repressor LexA n=1 Tax=Arenicella sp. 4NH20-0111 TaxID=3127648 RepID=UPI00310B7C44
MNTLELKPLTKRQQEIFDYILESMAANGAPPTRVEIAEHFGFRSPNAAEDHLKALDKKGHIELRSGTSRGILITDLARASMTHSSEIPGMIQIDRNKANITDVAVIGDVAAGAPIFAQEHVQQYISVDQSLFADKADFLLKVRGDSMINIGIFERDLLAIKKADRATENEIVVARIGDDVTVKRYHRQGATVSLIAENDDYDPIEVDLQTQTFAIEGIVVGLIRQGF